jgi:DNA helicase-2/ATP-dependent DNA helicase PcrA
MTHMTQQLHSDKSYLIPYSSELNPAQLEAVTYTEGPLLVIAGAGSGKTRTLTYRVARLVEEGISPASILLLTFTRKAADQMLKRASSLLDHRCEKVSGGTFHSFSNMILRRYAGQIGFDPRFVVIDRPDAESLIGMLRKEMGFVATHRAFPKKQTLASIFSKSINKMMPVEEILFNDYAHLGPYANGIVELYAEYTRRKKQHGFFDFDDLLIYLRRLLTENEQVREKLSFFYRYIMVDEYQDTNQLQADIVCHLASSHSNVMVVGDDSQSVYAFRGANFKNIIDFPRLFPGTKIIRLEENYRSVQPILDLANVIIDRAKEKYTKTLFTRNCGGNPPVLVSMPDENEQSRFVAGRIQELTGRGVPLDEIAVLFRASFHSFDLEIELNKRSIPFIKVGGFKFMEAAHIKDVLAHLRVLSNPYDRISWYRLLVLIENIGPSTAQRIFEKIQKKGSGYRGILEIEPKKSYAEGLERLKRLFDKIDAGLHSVYEMGEQVLDYYLPVLKATYDDHPKRGKDLEQLLSIMSRYARLEMFLTDMALEPPNVVIDDTFLAEPVQDRRLTLSTIHSAKGLEWHSVFIIWALDGRFPSSHAMEKEEELEEELRLMYVATTRAKANLCITYPAAAWDRNFGMLLSRPSRFVDEIPEEILQKQVIGGSGRINYSDFNYDVNDWS